MKLFALVLGLALASTQQVAGLTPPANAASYTACSEVIVRKELRSLSAAEWSAYESAVNQSQKDKWVDWFGYLHTNVAVSAHGNSNFFPFHRKFTRDYENILRKYDSSVALPYWNEPIDYQKPSTSTVLGSKFLGSNGESGSKCVTNGIAANWQLVYPNDHCFQREFTGNGDIPAWYSPEFITSTIQTSTTYADLRAGIENSIHGIIHLSMGGDMNTMYSPMDPVFWLHHANCDRYWAQWQAINPDDRTYMYDGTDINGNTVSLDDSVLLSSAPVVSVMRLGYGDMCYTYDTIKEANGDANSLSKRQKCIKRPNKQTQAITALPVKLLSKYYPSFAKGTNNILESEMSSIIPGQPMAADTEAAAAFVAPTPNEKMRGKMPYFSTQTEGWIKMMGYNVTEIRDLESRAAKMVDDLNEIGYLSPYSF
ncbi:hypothetical protein IW140_000692 [Coemansia sp. RSA 1813]|nr:hypothetical protein LPJ74_000476 [Coemansia sp. RSA 1843]KAJ2092423.1 hypothetical protein IW138_001185 [Coemansia sp. RSA 986]KAJ2217353.1 hypothetical protein EV179_000503 [Coemansia sp. RSA 487]KAJ2572577.1 hypothetical protein IW140_000692 [Coemansia sp. RSA 1813]